MAEDVSLQKFIEVLDWSVREVKEHNQ